MVLVTTGVIAQKPSRCCVIANATSRHAEVFEVVLAFMYTHEIQRLGRRQLSSSGIHSLLSAADMYLLDAMKVRTPALSLH